MELKGIRFVRLGPEGSPISLIEEDGTIYHIGYKIFEDKEGDPKFMFCGLHGSRSIKKDTWLKAEKKMVKDGTSKTEYESGFHVIPKKDDIADYSKRFKNFDNKVVCAVLYKGGRQKPTKNSLAWLADEIFVHFEDWAARKPLKDYMGDTK